MAKTDIKNETILNEIKDGINPLLNEKDAFQALINGMLKCGKGVYSHNSYPWKSRAVVKQIFEIAKETKSPLKIFIGSPKCEFHAPDELISKITEVSQVAPVTVVLAERPEGQLFEKWRSLASGNITVYCKKTKYDNTAHHLCMAGTAYRLETPHDKLSNSIQMTETDPQRPARFGFYRKDDIEKDDIEVLNNYWDKSVLADTIPINQISN